MSILPATLQTIIVRWLGLQYYETCWQAMRHFTHHRDQNTIDEIWLLEHFPVFTQGQNSKAEHILDPHDIRIVKTDRGGQVTYHGPGQLLIYTLIDIKRRKLNIREFVSSLEASVVQLLTDYGITAYSNIGAPGVYVATKKICSIGLRVHRGCTYHGVALNINMALKPFTYIHPCGFPELKMTQLAEFSKPSNSLEIGQELVKYLLVNLEYTTASYDLDKSDVCH
jgi:lipoyl(octanoyl) transferase